MKVLVILLVLVGFITIAPQVFGECEFLPCNDTNIEEGKPNYRFIDFSYANLVGEPIKFTLEKIAYNNCNSYNAEITDENGNLVGGEGRESLCAPNDNKTLVTSQIKIGYNEERPIIINESGDYTITIEIDNGSIQREFIVRKNHSGITLDRTVYPIIPPLKQFQSGISFDEIQCKQNYVLIQKYDGSPACVTESTKTKLIERGWTSSSTTVMINSNFEQDRDRIYTDPRNAVIDLEKNNSVKWINNVDYAVQVYDYENKSWSTGQIDPSMSNSIRFNSTGYYEFAVESANDRHFGEIIVISDDTNSLPIETRMKMGMSIVSNDLGKNPALIGVGTGDVNDGIVIDINQKELEKRDDANSYYYDMYKEMIPFDVPITIEFSEPLKLLE